MAFSPGNPSTVSPKLTKVPLSVSILLSDTVRFLGRFWAPMLGLACILFVMKASFASIIYFSHANDIIIAMQTFDSIASFLLSIFACKYTLQLLKKGKCLLSDSFPKVRHIVRVFLASVVVSLLIGLITFCVAIVVSILGGILSNTIPQENIKYFLLIFGFCFLFYLFRFLFHRSFLVCFIVDQECGVMGSIRESVNYSRGNFLKFLAILFLTYIPIVVIIVGIMACFVPAGLSVEQMMPTKDSVGVVIPFPYFVITVVFGSLFFPIYQTIMSVMYCQMTGQPTVFHGLLSQTINQARAAVSEEKRVSPEESSSKSGAPFDLTDDGSDSPGSN